MGLYQLTVLSVVFVTGTFNTCFVVECFIAYRGPRDSQPSIQNSRRMSTAFPPDVILGQVSSLWPHSLGTKQ